MFPGVADKCIDLVRRERLATNTHILMWWIMARLRDGNKLDRRESGILSSWIESEKLDVEPGSIQVVQFSRKEASSCFNGQQREVTRQVNRLINLRVLLPIGNHERGHAQLYVVFPDKVTKPRVECHPNANEDVVTPGSKRGDIDTEMGGHGKPVTCDDETYQEVIKNTNQGGAIHSGDEVAEESPLVCPECGTAEGVKVFNVVATCACGHAWRVD